LEENSGDVRLREGQNQSRETKDYSRLLGSVEVRLKLRLGLVAGRESLVLLTERLRVLDPEKGSVPVG
jgi:hypothetical protein